MFRTPNYMRKKIKKSYPTISNKLLMIMSFERNSSGENGTKNLVTSNKNTLKILHDLILQKHMTESANWDPKFPAFIATKDVKQQTMLQALLNYI